MSELKLRAMAKINLGLDVTGVREDGYHEVKMIMQSIYLYDRIFLNHEPWVIICNKEHFLAKHPEGVRVSELQDASLIIPIRQPIQNEINSWFNEIASERNIFCLYNSITSVMGFAEHNLGVIICPESAKNLINRETLTYRKIIDPVHESGTYLVKKHLQLMATATEKFWKYVEHQTKSNPSKYKESMR